MQVEIKIDVSCDETKVTITANKITDEVSELARKISEHTPSVLVGFQDGNASILDFAKVIRFYSANQKVYAVTEDAEYSETTLYSPNIIIVHVTFCNYKSYYGVGMLG